MDEKKVLVIGGESFYDKASHPSLTRGRVWCKECGATQKVNSAGAVQRGWPKCCGYTMTIDSPEEQKRLAE